MDHPTQRLLERTNLPESYSDRLRGAIKGLPLPRGVVHARMPDGSFAVFKDAGGKKRLATFLSKHMSPPGRDVTPLVKEKLMKKSANHMVEPSPDGGNYMAVSNLKSLKRNAEDMMCYVDPATPLPDWVESKLNVAAASIDDVADWFRNGGELNKTAAVPGKVKMYRRALQALKEQSHDFYATRSRRVGGAGKLREILDEGKITPGFNNNQSLPGVSDVYLGKGHPAGPWFRDDTALAIPHKELMKLEFAANPSLADMPAFQELLKKPRITEAGPHTLVHTAPLNPYHWVQAAGDVPVLQGSIAIAPEAELAGLKEVLKKSRSRFISAEQLRAAAEKIPASKFWPGRSKGASYKSAGVASNSLYDAVMKLAEDPRLEQAGVEGYNKPKRTPGHPTKSHIVVAKDGDQIKTIRFGQQGVKTNQTAGQREAFKSRHAKNIAKGKMSAAYWADKVKWSPSKTKDKDNDNWVKGSSDLSYLKKLADFANETLAQKAHDQVVKEYGLTPQDGSQYWRLKTRIYKSMGGTFTGKRAKKASETYRPRVELFIHDGKGNVLANRSDKGWQFPGGGIEEGQDIFEAARREALEEAGYKIKSPKALGNEASMVPWPEWYKEVARSKGRGQYEGQKTHAIVAQVGKKDNKLYGSEGDALTKLKFVPLKKLIRDGEKRVSPDHDDIVTNTGEVIPGFAVFSRDTLKHLKNLEQELAGKKTAADFSLMSVAKDLRKTAGVYDLSVRGPNTKEAGFNPFSFLTRRMASGKALTTRREFIGDALTNAGMTAATTGQAVTGGRRPSVLGKALSIFTGADSPMKITRRGALDDLAIRFGLYQKSRQLPVDLAGQKPGSALGQVASVAGNKMDEVMTKRDFLRNMFASGTLAAASSRGPAIQKLVDNRQITDRILSPAQMVSGVSAYGGLGTLAEGAKAMSKHPGDILGAASSLAPLVTKNAPEWLLKNPNNPVKNIVAGLA